MKRFLAFILTVCLVVTFAPFTFTASAATSGYYTYTVFNGKATITNVSESISGAVTIPSTLGGYPVTSIGEFAFRLCYSLKSVTICNGVTSIASSAFDGCTFLKSITIPDSVTSIASSAFWGCGSLESITVDENNPVYHSNGNCLIETESKTLVAGCKNSVIPTDRSVTSIGDMAFAYCGNLKSITIPDSVTSIGSSAFWDCANLESITVDKNNPVYHSNGNCLIETKSKTLVVGCKNSVIPTDRSVTSIGDKAFGKCVFLKSITIPDSVTSIGGSAFYYCSSLTGVDIPDSVTSIGDSAFYYCSSLTGVDIPDSVTSIGSSAFSYCLGLTSIDIPDSVTSIGNSAFYYCTSLTSIEIPDSVMSVGNYAFYGCDSLTSIVIPDSVTSIGGMAFSSCSSLTDVWYTGTFDDRNNITISNYNTCLTDATWHYGTCNDEHTYLSVHDGTCENCEWTREVANHTYDNACDITCNECDDVREVDHDFNDTYVCTICRIFKDEALNYTISDGNVTITEVKTSISGDVVIPSTLGGYPVTSIGGFAFEGCTDLTSITIPRSVTSIAVGAFYGCTGLTSIDIPNSVTSIGEGAFWGCENLTNIKIPDGVTSILEDAFANCTSLTSIDIPNSVTSIGSRAFSDCYSLTSIDIPNSVTSIGNNAFKGCTSLTSINIPDNVIFIGYGVFWNCESIESITVDENNPVYHSGGNCLIETESKTLIAGCKNSVIPSDRSVTFIGDWAFWGCGSLTSVVIPDCITSIGCYPFAYCAGIESIIVDENNPVYNSNGNCLIETESKTLILGCKSTVISSDGNVMSIGDNAFCGCESLTNITIPNSVTSIGGDAFWGCTALTSVTIGNSVASIGGWAFDSCTSLTDVWYTGSIDDRNNIPIDNGNEYLINATWHYETCSDEHTYLNVHDTTCENCEWTRTVTALDHVYDNACDTTCNECGNVREITHDYGDEWLYDDEYHWQKCAVCEHETEKSEHIVVDGVCTVCGADCYTAGDVDGEEGITANDAIYLLYHVFFGNESYPIDQPCDYDGDGSVTANDAIYLLYHVFFGDESYPLV